MKQALARVSTLQPSRNVQSVSPSTNVSTPSSPASPKPSTPNPRVRRSSCTRFPAELSPTQPAPPRSALSDSAAPINAAPKPPNTEKPAHRFGRAAPSTQTHETTPNMEEKRFRSRSASVSRGLGRSSSCGLFGDSNSQGQNVSGEFWLEDTTRCVAAMELFQNIAEGDIQLPLFSDAEDPFLSSQLKAASSGRQKSSRRLEDSLNTSDSKESHFKWSRETLDEDTHGSQSNENVQFVLTLPAPEFPLHSTSSSNTPRHLDIPTLSKGTSSSSSLKPRPFATSSTFTMDSPQDHVSSAAMSTTHGGSSQLPSLPQFGGAAGSPGDRTTSICSRNDDDTAPSGDIVPTVRNLSECLPACYGAQLRRRAEAKAATRTLHSLLSPNRSKSNNAASPSSSTFEDDDDDQKRRGGLSPAVSPMVTGLINCNAQHVHAMPTGAQETSYDSDSLVCLLLSRPEEET